MTWRGLSCLAAATLLLPPSGAGSCPVVPADREAETSLEYSAIGTLPIQVRWYDDPPTGVCFAFARINASSLPSHRLTPMPREVATAVAPIAASWGATECTIFVELVRDQGQYLDPYEQCWRGEYAFGDSAWWAKKPDHRCEEPDS